MKEIRRLIATLENQPPAEGEPQAPWTLAVQNARIILQSLEFHRAASISEATDIRDRRMAENVRWILEHETGARIVVGAANAHIYADPRAGSMGGIFARPSATR